MASLTIRNLEESLKEKLRIKAAMNGHSMEEEAPTILKNFLSHPSSTKKGSSMHHRFAKMGRADDLAQAIPARKDKARSAKSL